jgi:hypothetical protein
MTMEYDPEMPESSYENMKFDYEKAKAEAKEYADRLAEVMKLAAKYKKEKDFLSQLDITGDGITIVQFEIRDDGKVVWLNVNGITRTRICRITELHITDNREVNND